MDKRVWAWSAGPETGVRVVEMDSRMTIICEIPASYMNEEAVRDARLIAAAPELLEVLREARTDLANTRANVMVDLNKYDNLRWDGVPDALKDRIAIIDAAIAKATQS